jgi:hypothetical protein
VLVQTLGHVGIVFSAFAALRDEKRRGQPQRAGSLQTAGLGHVGDDDGDLRAGQAAFADVARDGQKIGTAAGEENAESGGMVLREDAQEIPPGAEAPMIWLNLCTG